MNVSRKIVAALIAATSLVGIGSYAVANGKGSSDPLAVTQVPISQEQAVNIALQNLPGTVRATEFEDDKNAMLWEVEIVDNTGQTFDVEIDANTGDVVSQNAADHDEDDDDDVMDHDNIQDGQQYNQESQNTK